MTPSNKLVVSFRGKKIDIPLVAGTSVGHCKTILAASVDESPPMASRDVKLLYKGKVLSDDDSDLNRLLLADRSSIKYPKTIRLMATGVSAAEAQANNDAFEIGLRSAPRIRDDLTASGRAEIARRERLGRATMKKSAARSNALHENGKTKYGFGSIETLKNLPHEDTARELLNTLANDPGILACMQKHEWNVGCLAELYPEGKVGESEVCVMGLNRNKGQKILLRLRTDDLKGFRKILSIRKVLFHELAHNVHSEHDGKFFLLMRQIEKECNEMDWTRGSGHSTGDTLSQTECNDQEQPTYIGGSFRLGGGDLLAQSNGLTRREVAARAAMMRLTAEEEEIQMHCGCGKEAKTDVEEESTESVDKK